MTDAEMECEVLRAELDEARDLLQIQFRHNTYLTREIEWLKQNATIALSAANVLGPNYGVTYESGYMPDSLGLPASTPTAQVS